MPSRKSIPITIELVPEANGTWGYCFSMPNTGGSGGPMPSAEDALLAGYRLVRREVLAYLETREEKASRLAKWKERTKS